MTSIGRRNKEAMAIRILDVALAAPHSFAGRYLSKGMSRVHGGRGQHVPRAARADRLSSQKKKSIIASSSLTLSMLEPAGSNVKQAGNGRSHSRDEALARPRKFMYWSLWSRSCAGPQSGLTARWCTLDVFISLSHCRSNRVSP